MAENNNSNQNQEAALRALWNNAMPFVREHGGLFLGNLAKSVTKSEKAGNVVNSTFQAGLSVSAPAKDLLEVGKKTRKEMTGLLEGFAPALTEEYGKSSRAKLMTSKNQVIAHERGRMMGKAKYGVYDTLSGFVALAPDLLIIVDKKREKLLKEAKKQEKSAAKEAVAENQGAATKGKNDGKDAAAPADVGKDASGAQPDALGDVQAKLEQQFGKLAASDAFSPENRKVLEMGVRTGAPIIQKYFQSSGKGQFGTTSAYTLINTVVKQAHSGNGHMDYVMHPKAKEQMPLKEYVLEVFKQHQEDMGEAPLNKRFRYMPEMEEACAIIADEIKDNLLDPRALVSLVGNRTVLDEHMGVSSPETVRAEIGKIRRAIEKTENIDPQKFIADTAFATKGEFKEILDGMPAEDKPFFVSLFPDVVLQKLGGMKEPEITEMRAKGEQEFVSQMAEAIQTLGALDAETQQRYGLTAQESKMMHSLAKDFEKKGVDETMEALKGQKRVDVVEAVRNAKGYWQDLVAGRGTRNDPAVREAERITASAADPAGEAPPLSDEEKSTLDDMEKQFSDTVKPRHAEGKGFADREKSHTAHGERKYADAAARKGDHSEHRVR